MYYLGNDRSSIEYLIKRYIWGFTLNGYDK